MWSGFIYGTVLTPVHHQFLYGYACVLIDENETSRYGKCECENKVRGATRLGKLGRAADRETGEAGAGAGAGGRGSGGTAPFRPGSWAPA